MTVKRGILPRGKTIKSVQKQNYQEDKGGGGGSMVKTVYMTYKLLTIEPTLLDIYQGNSSATG